MANLNGYKTYIMLAFAAVMVIAQYMFGVDISADVASGTAELTSGAIDSARVIDVQIQQILNTLFELGIIGAAAAMRHGVSRTEKKVEEVKKKV